MLKRNLIVTAIICLVLALAGNTFGQRNKRKQAPKRSAKQTKTTKGNTSGNNRSGTGRSRKGQNNSANNNTLNSQTTNQRRRASVQLEDIQVSKAGKQSNQQTPENSQTNILPYVEQNNLKNRNNNLNTNVRSTNLNQNLANSNGMQKNVIEFQNGDDPLLRQNSPGQNNQTSPKTTIDLTETTNTKTKPKRDVGRHRRDN